MATKLINLGESNKMRIYILYRIPDYDNALLVTYNRFEIKKKKEELEEIDKKAGVICLYAIVSYVEI